MAKKEKKSEIAEIFEEASKDLKKGEKKNTKKTTSKAKDTKAEKAPAKEKSTKVFADVVKKTIDGEKCFFIKNLKDLPNDIKKGLKAYHKKPVDAKSSANLKKAMTALGVTTSKEASIVMPERERKAPPKFEPRTFKVGGNKMIELGNNHNPKAGDMYLIITEEKKGKKTVKDVMVVYLMYAGNEVIYVLVPKTEDAIVGTPEMLKKREIWSVDLDTKEPLKGKEAMHGLFIPVKMEEKEKKEAVNE